MSNGIKNKKILLIGGTGFIGLHLARRLSELNSNITAFCRDPDKVKELDFIKKINFVNGDITDYKVVERSIKNNDVIINLVSIVNPSSPVNLYKDLETNCKGQLNVLEARKKLNPKSRYIFLGTRAQFGKVKKEDLSIAEDYCQNPISLYGIHKQTAENYCKLYKRAFNLKSIILRLPQVYGPSLIKGETHSIINKFIKKAIKGEKFYVNGYGKDIKDVIYVDDVVDLIISILNSNVDEGIFNVGSGEKIQLIDIAKKIIELCGSGSFKAVPFPPNLEKFELGSCYFDISKVKKTFKWKPRTRLEEGIKKTIEFYKKDEIK